ncbi:Uncharacterised protein [Mycobacteroides abscessus subsp. abscessus]|nr:Uncharacterised protein [Mycobacteroides abscessus subsp. abscessus]
MFIVRRKVIVLAPECKRCVGIGGTGWQGWLGGKRGGLLGSDDSGRGAPSEVTLSDARN